MDRQGRRRNHSGLAALGLLLGLSPRSDAQAFTPEQGLWSLTTLFQVVDNTGHRMSDGFMLRDGQSLSTGALADVEYGVTNRFAVTLGLPFIMAKYRGVGPTPANLPVDSCRCWHSGLQDFTGTARYRFGEESFAFTPTIGVTVPSHAYNYQGEAVLGRRLRELRLGGTVAVRPAALAGTVLSATYAYAVVQKDVVDIPNNRSNATIDIGRSFGDHWSMRVSAGLQRTHGGLRFGSIRPGASLPFPGEVGFSGPKFQEHDRLLRDNYASVGGGLTYSMDKTDLFAAISVYVSGTDAHDGQAFTIGATWYFGGPPSPR